MSAEGLSGPGIKKALMGRGSGSSCSRVFLGALFKTGAAFLLAIGFSFYPPNAGAAKREANSVAVSRGDAWRIFRAGMPAGYACLIRSDQGKANLFGRFSSRRGMMAVSPLQRGWIESLRRMNPRSARRISRAARVCRVAQMEPPCSPTTPCAVASLSFELNPHDEVQAGSSVEVSITARDRAGNLSARGLPREVRIERRWGQGELTTNRVLLSTERSTFSLADLTAAGPHVVSLGVEGVSAPASQTVLVLPGEVSTLSLGGVPDEVGIHQAFGASITAFDRFGNVASNFSGPVDFSVRGAEGQELEAGRSSLVEGRAGVQGIKIHSGGMANFKASLSGESVQSNERTIAVRTMHSTALAWSNANIAGLSNLQPMVVVRDWGVFDQRNSLLGRIDRVAGEVKSALEALPEGQRALLFLWDMFPLVDDPRDAVVDHAGVVQGYQPTQGAFRPFASLWWDSSARDSRYKVDALLAALKARGAPLDYIIADSESWLNHWATDVIAARNYGANDQEASSPEQKEARRLAVYQAIDNDPRMELPDQAEFGFSGESSIREQLTSGNLVPDVSNWWAAETKNDPTRRAAYLQYDYLMENRSAQYKNWAVFETAKRHYPNIKMSDYGYIHHSPAFPVPDTYGHEIYLFSGVDEKIVGNLQAEPMYGAMPDWAVLFRWAGPGNYLFQYASAFAAVRHTLNRKLAATFARPDVPFQSWIAPYSFSDGGVRIGGDDYYKELFFHLALTSSERFLFWNDVSVSSREDNELVSALLEEYDRVSGYSLDRRNRTPSLIPWTQNYILTVQQGDAGCAARFTPMLSDEVTIDSVIAQVSPPTFVLPTGEILSFPGARLERDVFSEKGVWLFAERPEALSPVLR